jgi:signal transduction histidine kinase
VLLARLRWSAFGLRGRIVGAVVATTAISLGVAALVLLPRLEGSLKKASLSTLEREVGHASADLTTLAQIPYWIIPEACVESEDKKSPLSIEATKTAARLKSALNEITGALGATAIAFIGDVDADGSGHQISDVPCNSSTGSVSSIGDVKTAYVKGETQFPVATNAQLVSAVIPLNLYYKRSDAVLAVGKSIDEIPDAVSAVEQAFEIAAAVAILLIVVLAIPLAGTLVSRLQRLRQAALQLAIGGNVGSFPADRARDEVGDLARSFSMMQRRLRQQEEARRAFVATASHELRTPLASLEGMLELLADDLQGEQPDLDDAAALLDRARVQSRRLARLAADLLDLSRIDAEVSLRSEPIELSELGRAVLAEFELPSASRGVAIALLDDGKPTWALADPGSVARIVRILVDNALRVAPEGSQIRVLMRSNPEPMLVVSDEGPGVAEEERALIFDRFKRGRETGGEAGFGLGLAIGRELAQRMGGSLVLTDSEGPGATFTLRLQPTEAPTSDRLASNAGV